MRLKIEKLDHQGRGIAHEEGKIVFVQNALPGEEVEAKMTKETSKYSQAEVVEYITKSTSRAKNKCPYYPSCGGCHLRHMSYDGTLKFKANKLVEIYKKYAHLDVSPVIVKNKEKDFYRNKVEVHIKDGVAGFYKNESKTVVELDRCLIVQEAINVILRSLDFLHLKNADVTIKANYNDEVIIVIASCEEAHIDTEVLREKVKLVGIVYNDQVYFGADHFIERIGGFLFKETYNSFFQVNRYMTEELFKIVLENLRDGETVLDMCSGVGTLSIVASTKAKKVYGIEVVPNAVKDAIVNSRMNKIDNVEFLLADAFMNAGKIEDKIDTIIIDPPRTGLSSEGIDNILKIKPSRIIYIACDAITQARDISLLNDCYSVSKVYMLDMFSYTYHVECVSIMNRR